MSIERKRRSGVRKRLGRSALAVALVAVCALAASACGGSSSSGDSKGEIVITCSACQASPTDPFLQFHYEAVQRFNQKYKGKYRVKILQNQYAADSPDRLQYYQRLALAGDLADLFMLNSTELEKMKQTGKLMNLKPALDADPAWEQSFLPRVFLSLMGENGEVYGIPEQRASMGIYYNRAVLRDAGVSEYPETWDQLDATCKKVKAAGKTCIAMDGDFATLMFWAHLIGTQPGGRDFLSGGNRENTYAENPAVVRATETLKRWYDDGYINGDALSGKPENATAPFDRGDAAFIGSGPWFVSTDIKGKDAVKGLYDEVGYEPAPGWSADQRGVITSSAAGWFSGTSDARKQEAVVAWMKFISSRSEEIEQLHKTNSYPPIKVRYTAEERASQEPLAAHIAEAANEVAMTYPHAYTRAPAGFGAAWRNLFPAYIKGEMSTHDFLSQLGEDANSTTG